MSFFFCHLHCIPLTFEKTISWGECWHSFKKITQTNQASCPRSSLTCLAAGRRPKPPATWANWPDLVPTPSGSTGASCRRRRRWICMTTGTSSFRAFVPERNWQKSKNRKIGCKITGRLSEKKKKNSYGATASDTLGLQDHRPAGCQKRMEKLKPGINEKCKQDGACPKTTVIIPYLRESIWHIEDTIESFLLNTDLRCF